MVFCSTFTRAAAASAAAYATAVLHFKINIWILISKKFTLGYGSSVRCLLNPGSRQAPSRGAVTGWRGTGEVSFVFTFAGCLVGW